MAWKISKIFCLLLVISCCFATVTQAQTFTVYQNGTMSSTYVNYFRDIVSGIPFNDNYVAFRAGQYEYIMIVGDIEYDNGTFTASTSVGCYRFYNDNSYGSTTLYNFSTLDGLNLNASDSIIYSDLGEYPQLIERGAKYEIINTFTFCIALLFGLVYLILRKC